MHRILSPAAALLLTLTLTVRAAEPAAAPALDVRFLTQEQAAEAIVDDAGEPYFARLQPLEMAAKTGAPITGDTLDAQRDVARARYAAAAEAFTDDEQQTIRWYVERVQRPLALHYPKLARDPWSFLKVSSVIEGGLPHTRGPHIVLSGRIVEAMKEMRQFSADIALAQFGELLIHEKVHVVQRLHPGTFDELYKDVWGFIHVDAIDGGDWLRRHQAVNPDGVDVNWLVPVKDDDGNVTRYIWPRLVFAEVEKPRMPVDFRLIGIHVEKTETGYRAKLDGEGRPVFTMLAKDPDYDAAVPPSGSIYHPNEIAADVIASLIAGNHLLPDDPLADEVRQKLTHGRERELRWIQASLK